MKILQRLLYYICVAFRSHRSRTVHLAFPLVFVAATFLGAAALLHKDTSYIRIESSKNQVSAGENFKIKVFVGAHVPVNAIDIRLKYPKDKVTINNIDIGESVITIWTKEPYVEGDKIIMSGGTFRRGFISEHLIATINAEATQGGKASFSTDNITLLAGDGTGEKVAVGSSGSESLTLLVNNVDGSIDGKLTLIITTDIDGDGDVSLSDVNSFMSSWFSGEFLYDFNKDKKMNFTDFAIILSDSFFK